MPPKTDHVVTDCVIIIFSFILPTSKILWIGHHRLTDWLVSWAPGLAARNQIHFSFIAPRRGWRKNTFGDYSSTSTGLNASNNNGLGVITTSHTIWNLVVNQFPDWTKADISSDGVVCIPPIRCRDERCGACGAVLLPWLDHWCGAQSVHSQIIWWCGAFMMLSGSAAARVIGLGGGPLKKQIQHTFREESARSVNTFN